jgi:hypothetical protein
MTASPFLAALHAAGPAPDRADAMGLYGWLVGSWALDVTEFLPDGDAPRRRPGAWHFGWVLEGRAIQDVWTVPARDGTEPGYCGTTLRTWDPRIGAWRIQYTDPAVQAYLTMIGRREGADIVQLGTDSAGAQRRWSFSEIAPGAFRWRGEVSPDGGATWNCHIDFRARRLASG